MTEIDSHSAMLIWVLLHLGLALVPPTVFALLRRRWQFTMRDLLIVFAISTVSLGLVAQRLFDLLQRPEATMQVVEFVARTSFISALLTLLVSCALATLAFAWIVPKTTKGR